MSTANASHAVAAVNPPINDRAAGRARKPKAGFGPLDTSSTTELTCKSAERSAQNVEIDPLGELSRIGALLDDVHPLEFVGVEHKLLLERGSDGMVMVSMTAIHSGEILHGSFAAV